MEIGLRDRKREATRASIWHSAMRLFSERGYDSVTVEEIAAVCELSPRTFFRYFGTKEDVLFAGTEVRRTIFLEDLESQPADAAPFEAIAGASRSIAALYQEDRDALRTRARIIESAPSLSYRNASFSPMWDTDVMQVLRESGRADGMGELELRLVTGAAMTALRVTIEQWISPAEEQSELLVLLDDAFGALARGLGKASAGLVRRPRTRRKAAS